MTLSSLTALSTALIGGSGLCLLIGWFFIRRKEITRHRNSMLTATALAGGFLVAYITRWNLYGSKPFEGTGGWRTLYLAILVPHILLAMAVAPMALALIYLALGKQDFRRHKWLARITLPVWLFVAVSGWAIYFMLYKMTF